ncbi:MAG: transcription antitermination factor NusB [Actinomycetota bacterium]
MKSRRVARRLALDVLYEAEIRDMLPIEAYRERRRLGWKLESGDANEPPPDEIDDAVLAYARYLIEGVQEHHADIDLLITTFADRWTIERMPVVDRNVIRLAVFELKWADDVPVAVAINEAVELAKSLSTEDSGRFVNGLLGRIVEESALLDE